MTHGVTHCSWCKHAREAQRACWLIGELPQVVPPPPGSTSRHMATPPCYCTRVERSSRSTAPTTATAGAAVFCSASRSMPMNGHSARECSHSVSYLQNECSLCSEPHGPMRRPGTVSQVHHYESCARRACYTSQQQPPPPEEVAERPTPRRKITYKQSGACYGSCCPLHPNTIKHTLQRKAPAVQPRAQPMQHLSVLGRRPA